jgi:hypothetical protein
MQTNDEILKINEELANRINQEALANPQSPYAGKYVGIADGKVIISSDSLDEVADFLRQQVTDLRRARIVEASRDYNIVEEIWELH